MSHTSTHTTEDEIDLGELFQVLKRYRLLIILVTLVITFLAAAYAYVATSIYTTNATVEVVSERYAQNDFMSMALGKDSSNVENEAQILKSRWIISKAIASLSLNTMYFTQKNYRTIELYKQAPFVVDIRGIGPQVQAPFNIYPIDEQHFRLETRPSLMSKLIDKVRGYVASIPDNERAIDYSMVHEYDKPVMTPWFQLMVKKVYEPTEPQYTIMYMSNKLWAERITNSLSINNISEYGSILSLNYSDTHPARAKEIVNAITAAYLEAEFDRKTESADKSLKFLDQQLDAINKTLQSSAQELQQYKATNVIIDVGSKAQITAEKLSELESQRYEIGMQLDVLSNTYDYVINNQDLTEINLGSLVTVNPGINDLILKIQEDETIKKSLLIDYTELHPDVIKISGRLDSLKGMLRNSLEGNIRALSERKRSLNKIIHENTQEMEALPEQERQLTQLSRSFMVNEKVYSYLLQKRAEQAVIKSSTVTGTRVIDSAEIPFRPVKPKRQLIVIVGMFLGLILGTALAFLRNHLNNTVQNIEDIEKHSPIPLYGAVPHLNNKKNIQPFMEAMRVIRTNLEFLQQSDRSKLVTLTSSVPTEGKTTISTELAKIIARTHKKVLIVDLDLRRSRVHEKFKLSNEKGMSTLLAGKHTLDDVIVSTEYENLQVLTAGPVPPNPSELLMTSNFNMIIDNLLTKYDYVLLDSPPIGLVTDAMMLMKRSDINLFVFRAKFSKKDFIKNINRFVKEHELHNSGIILNGLELNKKFGYGYGYGYGYGHAHDYYDTPQSSS